MTSKSIEERVDVLLEVGTQNPKRWMKVHGYLEPEEWQVLSEGWKTEWQRLRAHHLDETSFLFQIIDELVKRCGKPTSKTG